MEILAQSSTAFVLTYNFHGTHILGASRGRLSDSVASCYPCLTALVLLVGHLGCNDVCDVHMGHVLTQNNLASLIYFFTLMHYQIFTLHYKWLVKRKSKNSNSGFLPK